MPDSLLPAVDVSAVTHNSARWVEAFIESLAAQDYPMHRVALFLRDHESTDGTADLCRSLLDRYRGRFRQIEFVEGENRGFGFGHNRNRERGSAPYFLVTNVDLVLEVPALTRVVQFAIVDDAETVAWELRQKPYEHPKHYDPRTLETEWASSACVLFRRSALEDVHGYEERIFLYGEDVELSFRLRDRGYRLRYCPSAVCWHYCYDHADQIKPAQFFGGALSNMYIRLRYGSAADVCVGLARQLSLWLRHPQVPRVWSGLFRNAMALLRNAPYFLRTRKRSALRFRFSGWNYAVHRDGAFLPAFPLPDNPPLATVVTRTHAGRLPWLEQAVASVMNQTYPRVELVVVEDGSAEVRQFVESVARSGKLTSVVYLSIAKAGRCKAGNTGLARASGEFITFLDDDDLFYADHLETICGALLADSGVAAAYGLAFEVPTTLLRQCPLEIDEKAMSVVWRQRFSRAILWHHNYLPIQAVVFRRSLFERLGGFDESLENLEDWDLWTRYSLSQDFRLIEKVTSAYRVPGRTRDLMARHRKLKEHYHLAVEKQRRLRVSLSPAEVVEMSAELSRNVNAVVIPYVRIRNVLVKHPLLNAFYFYAVRLANRFRDRTPSRRP